MTSVTYFVVINGDSRCTFSPKRGFRQGNPLFQYLFIMCEAFSCLLENALISIEIHGIKVGRNSPSISHLFSDNDNLILARANIQEMYKVMNIVKAYEEASGRQNSHLA